MPHSSFKSDELVVSVTSCGSGISFNTKRENLAPFFEDQSEAKKFYKYTTYCVTDLKNELAEEREFYELLSKAYKKLLVEHDRIAYDRDAAKRLLKNVFTSLFKSIISELHL